MFAFRRPVALAVLAVALLLALAGPSHPALAATINVNTTNDELNSDGDCSLREAIQAANTDAAVSGCSAGSGADTIDVPAGTYTLTIPGTDEDANVTGDLDITSDIAITGAGANNTIIQACDSSSGPCTGIDRVLHVAGSFNIVTISDVTIRNGNNSSAISYWGGGIANFGAMLTVSDSVVSMNTVSFGFGGGIYNAGGTLNLTRSTVSGNGTSSGGGIRNDGTLIVSDSTVSGNRAGDGGGGIYNVGTLIITNSAVSGNTAAFFGGILTSGGTAILTNSTISGNSASDSFFGLGGGIYNDNSTLTLSNSTISGNMAGSGGGIMKLAPGTTTLKNTIVANNPSGGDCAGAINSLGHNLSSDASCAFAGPGDLNNTNAMLGLLANNGGPTETHALLGGSPAIDAGSGDCPPPATDQRGVARPQDGDGNSSSICDIGAFELAGPATPGPVGGFAIEPRSDSSRGFDLRLLTIGLMAATAIAAGASGVAIRRR